MSFWKRFTGVALLFALGFLAGVTVSSNFDLNSAADGPRHMRYGPSPLSSSFYTELSLSDQQRSAVEAIAEEYRSKLGELRKSMAPRIHEMLAQAEREIEPILDAEQKTQYKSQLSEWEERHRRLVDYIEKKRHQYDSRAGSKADSR